jgi:hypothetical protein
MAKSDIDKCKEILTKQVNYLHEKGTKGELGIEDVRKLALLNDESIKIIDWEVSMDKTSPVDKLSIDELLKLTKQNVKKQKKDDH